MALIADREWQKNKSELKVWIISMHFSKKLKAEFYRLMEYCHKSITYTGHYYSLRKRGERENGTEKYF